MDGGGPLLKARTRERLVPPSPVPPERDLSIPALCLGIRRNGVAVWPKRAYEDLLVHRRFFGIDHYVINDPQAVRHVLRERAEDYVRPVSMHRILGPGVGAGLLLAEGEAWLAQRRAVGPVFAPAQIRRLIPRIRDATETALRCLSGGMRVNLAAVLQAAALESLGRALLMQPMSGRAGRLIDLAREYFTDHGRPQLSDLLARRVGDFGWTQAGRRDWSRRWFAEIEAIIGERRAAPLAPDAEPDALEFLRAARGADGAPLDDRAVRDEIASMTVAGFETTSRLLIWAVYLLARDPAEQAGVHAELARTPPEAIAAAGDLKAWPRLTNVLLETLRLYPPVPSMIRTARAPDRVLGAEIKPGDRLVVSAWLMHRHRRWWDQAGAFIPERFAAAPERLRDGTFMPFGLGRRTCVGASFAMTQASLVLAGLLSRYEIALDDDRPVMPVGNTTLTPSVEPWFRLKARR